MTTAQKPLLVVSLGLIAGLGVHQHRQIQALQDEIDHQRECHAADIKNRATRLCEEESMVTHLRCALQPDSIALAERDAIAAEPAATEMVAWIERVQLLKNHMTSQPDLKTPTMNLLAETDWLEAARIELSKQRDYRRAAAHLRNQADDRFMSIAQQALAS